MSDKVVKEGLLYSGGFDSVALLDVILKDEKTKDLTVVFELSDQMQGEAEVYQAKKVYNYLKRKHAREGLTVRWLTEKINLSWFKPSLPGGDTLLSTHLMTAMRHGEIKTWYTGWHKNHMQRMSLSKSIRTFLKKYAMPDFKIYYMEDFFSADSEFECKCKTIDYLLKEKLFDLPYTFLGKETLEEFKARDYWYTNDAKINEVASALITIDEFKTGDYLATVMKAKNTREIQKFYNELTNDKKKKIKKVIERV